MFGDMLKRLNLIICTGLITVLISCNAVVEDVVVVESEFDMNGTWALTNYFDTIIKNKSIAKYRMQGVAMSSIILVVDNDSVSSYGSILNNRWKFNKSKDTLASIYCMGSEMWNLFLKEENLCLIQDGNASRLDSTVYMFKRRDDFNYFTTENEDFFVIGKNVTEYFNKELFEGKYIDEKSGKEVVFEKNGQLRGVQGFDSFEVRNYFGTLHPHKNLDVISFRNGERNEWKQYNWVFSNDELLLTEFVYEQQIIDGKSYHGDDMVLGNQRIVLKAQ